MKRTMWTAVIRAGLALATIAAASGPAAAADDDPWAAGTNWLTMRAGFAKSTVEGAGRGGPGFAFGYSRMLAPRRVYKWSLLKHYSLGAFVQHDVVGQFGEASQIAVPATVELVRHYQWKTALKPYLGLGVGGFYRKLYRTGGDERNVDIGGYLTLGANSPVAPGRILGMDFRVARTSGKHDAPNPVFGPGHSQATHWSAKVGYSITY